MDRRRSSAVRLLPDGTDHDRRGASCEDSESDRRRDHQGHEWQSLPLRNLRAHTQSRAPRRFWRRCAMSPLSRREFVAAGAAAGAGLVIGFYLPHGGTSGKEGFSPSAYLRITPDNKVTIEIG